jgi:hypothetical protein
MEPFEESQQIVEIDIFRVPEYLVDQFDKTLISHGGFPCGHG